MSFQKPSFETGTFHARRATLSKVQIVKHGSTGQGAQFNKLYLKHQIFSIDPDRQYAND